MAEVRVAEILASLAAGGPPESWADQLVSDCCSATQMSGVGMAVMGPDGHGGVLATTGGSAQRMEDLQFSLGEGPCVEAARSGSPVLVADLTHEATRRWPAFAPEAVEAGVQAAFTFPLQVGAIGIGVLDLYQDTRGELSAAQLAQALAYADAGVAVLLYLQDRSGGHADGKPGRRPGDGGLEVARAVDRRAVVHQATGMIAVQLGVNLAVAMSRLRAHAFSSERSILEIAADVVDRRLQFDHGDDGTTSAPGHEPPRASGEEELS